jgi:hypothetical protein
MRKWSNGPGRSIKRDGVRAVWLALDNRQTARDGRMSAAEALNLRDRVVDLLNAFEGGGPIDKLLTYYLDPDGDFHREAKAAGQTELIEIFDRLRELTNPPDVPTGGAATTD